MRIAVVGAGIAGLASAWLLSREHEVVLYERNDYLGGHTHTHDVVIGQQCYAVDTGFIVFNPPQYPLLSRMFDELGVASQPTTMSFSLTNQRSGVEYNATNLDGLFCQRRNLVSPRFLGMVRDIARFYREAPALLDRGDAGPTIADYLAEHRYSDAFRDDHLIPMASALWSSPTKEIMKFPAKYLVQFMANHQMMRTSGRPQWRVVKGGSREYVRALRKTWRVSERTEAPVRRVRRYAEHVDVETAVGNERFDHVVMACHSDQSLALLADASPVERDVLGAIAYQENDTVLHTDASQLPKHRKAWAAWNAIVPREPSEQCTVSYCMNLLQSLDCADTIVVTLNRTAHIDPTRILKRMRYHHPVYSHASVAAQARKPEVQGHNRTWFAGAYWGWGFHEDGMRSAVDVTRELGVRWP
ncbi:MAG TPA: FAD-dependent oxidoreductase [Rudaea sp.]|nr:FAD-dependent oxidoreductase [Rudaea sp.]